MDTAVCSEVIAVLKDEPGGAVGPSTASVAKILAQIKRFQERIRKHIEDNYVEFMPNHTSADLYLEEGERLVHEAEHLLQTGAADATRALQEANVELIACMDELRETSLGLRLAYRILKVDDLFQCVEEANGTKEYPIVLDVLNRLKGLIYASDAAATADSDSDVNRLFAKCECYETIKVKYHIQHNILKQNLQQRFDQLVQFTEKPFPQTKCVTLQVSKDIGQLQDTVMALFQARYNPTKLCDFLWANCLEPIILKPVSLEVVEVEKPDASVQLKLSYSLKELGRHLRPSYRQVFEHIRSLLQCLDGINVSVAPQQHVFTIIGDHVRERLLQLLIDECLMHAIPETMDEMRDSTLVEDVLQFEHTLADVFLIQPETNRNLTAFTENFEELFRNRFCRKLLESSKDIMQKDLQDMTAVATENTAEDVANDAFLFPRCMVSKSVLELIQLLERIMRLPTDEQTAQEESFLNVNANILLSYLTVVPQLHAKLLESIPQQAALFNNNCHYLAHWVAKRAEAGVQLPDSPALIKMLQATGLKHLQAQKEYQQKILLGILRDFDPASDAHSLGAAPLKLVRQCLRQLDLLRNVWQSVLPDQLYNRTFCDLLNDVGQELMRRILVLEDISATVATELSELINVVLEKAPLLFKSPHEVVHIKCWQRLQHLKLILNASLQAITEQWCDGAGILTASFKADEVKHLVRALFQNTDRRAQALARIV